MRWGLTGYFAVGLTCLALTGCSSYQVTRAPLTQSLDSKTQDGVVFILGRPEFTLKKVDGSDPITYQPVVTYVADEDQRYVVRMRSSPLADITFDLAFNDQGGLSSSTAESQQQVGPTITALASFATKAMAASRALAALSPKYDAAGVDYPKCLTRKGLGATAACALTVAGPDCGPIKPDLGPSGRLALYFHDDKDVGDPLATLVALNAPETSCFSAAAAGMKSATDALILDLQQKLILSNGSPFTEAAATFGDILKQGDTKTARRLVYAIALAADANPDTSPLQKILKVPVTPAQAQSMSAAFKAIHVSADDDVTPVETASKGQKVAKALKDAGALDPGPWRARAIVNLQDEIISAERGVLFADPDANAEIDPAVVMPLRHRLAATVNMEGEFQRMIDLQARIKIAPALSVTTRQSQMAEYANYEKEAAAIQAELDKRLQATQAKAAAKSADTLPPSVAWVKAACIDKSQDPRWLYTYGVDAPAFVIVLKHPNDGKALDPKKSPLECGS